MSDWSPSDYQFMAKAIQLARKGMYTTHPNPRVGCVLVNDGRIVGQGWHQKAGDAHAEVNALREAGTNARGATAYVTLEPCSHHGRTPPCCDALIKAKVGRVVAAMKDPNPLVAGSGLKHIKESGIEVSAGLLETQARELNPGFIKRMEFRLPWVRIKLAASIDGRTAMASGESKWITGPFARADVQRMRARSSAIMTGLGTIVHDDAALTVRARELGLENADEIAALQPLRVVIDQRGGLSGTEKLFLDGGDILLVVSEQTRVAKTIQDNPRVDLLSMRSSMDERVDLRGVLEALADKGCNEVLIESGATLAGGFFQEELWDELVLYSAPCVMGSDARALMNLPWKAMSQSERLCLVDQRFVGDDMRITFRADRGKA